MCLHSEPSKVSYSTIEKLVEHFFGKHKNIFEHKYQACTQNCHLTFNKNSVSSPHPVPNIKRQMTNDSVALILWVKTEIGQRHKKQALSLLTSHSMPYTLWQYGLWSFHTEGTKLERFLPRNQHTQRKLLNFENWVNGEVSKIGHHVSK